MLRVWRQGAISCMHA